MEKKPEIDPKKRLEDNIRFVKDRTKDYLTVERRAKKVGDIMYGTKRDALYSYYDSPKLNIEKHFEHVLKPFNSFEGYLDAYYGDRAGDLIGVELGGPGGNFFREFPNNFFKKTAGFTLREFEESYRPPNHEIIEADVFFRSKDRTSWDRVLDWVKKNGKPDFVIERMIGPLGQIVDPKLFLLIVDRWYRILADEGSIFIQMPTRFFKDDFEKMEIALVNLSKEVKGIDLKFHEIRVGYSVGSILIRKLPGAPKSIKEGVKIVLLSPKEKRVFDACKGYAFML